MPTPHGEVIREKRLAEGYGLNEFARNCGIDPGNLSRIERGAAGARMSTLRRIAEALHVTVRDIAAL